jgi:hypothetical protein
MDMRATLNAHPRTTLIALLGIILLMFAYSFPRAMHRTRHGPPAAAAFYTDDDGQTLFVDVPGLLTPFDHNGKPAVSAAVFTADNGQHRWVQYLQKYNDDAAQQFSSAAGNHVQPTAAQLFTTMRDFLVKKPGAETWIPVTDPAAQELMQPTIPEGMGSGPIAPAAGRPDK